MSVTPHASPSTSKLKALAHTPMSERQQLALIKQIEAKTVSPDSCLTSPTRAPLQVVNGPRGDTTPTTTKTPSQSKTPAEERLHRKLNKRNAKGETPLHKACMRGQPILVKKLLKLGAKTDVKDNAEWTPLHEACNKGHDAVVRVLLEFNAPVNAEGHGKETPLHDAVKNGHFKVVKLLVRHGADLTARNSRGQTPLHAAHDRIDKVSGIYEIIQYLKSAASSENLSSPDFEDVSPDVSDEDESEDVLKFLGLSNAQVFEPLIKKAGLQDTPQRSHSLAMKKALVTKVSDKPGSPKVRLNQLKGDVQKAEGAKTRLTYGMEGKEESTSQNFNHQKGEDVYEFKSSSKEATPVSSRSSTSPEPAAGGASGSTSAPPTAAGTTSTTGGSQTAEKEEPKTDKRPAAEAETEDDQESKKKRRKEEVGSATAKEPGKGRGNRGGSSEKSVGKGGGKGRGGADRKSPSVNTSAANSPKSTKAEPNQSDSDEENSKKSSDSSSLKVPPLKIVLSGGNMNGSGTNGAAGNGTGTGIPETAEKKPTAATSGQRNAYVVKDEEGEKAGGNPEEKPDGEAAGGDGTATGSRMTRSRANHGPDNANNDTASNSESSGSAAENIEREPNKTYTDYHVKKRKLRNQVDEMGAGPSGRGNNGGGPNPAAPNEPANDIDKYVNIRKQVEQRRRNLFPVQPKPPEGYKDYLMNRKTYLLQGNAHERLRSIPMIQPPPSLDGPLRAMFVEQEKDRYKLRVQHLVEKEKLVLSVEQEILRVHGRAARALANQPKPYSVCTILQDEEIYTPIDPQQEEKNRDIRSRYNGRLFLSWLQDVDDKWEKIKEQMVLRHHNEAESLNAVQKMDWEWKVKELSGNAASDNVKNQIDDLHIPMVHVSDDFDLSDCRQ